MNIVILNYGTSNIKSIFNSLKKIKKINIKINDFNLKKFDKIILPGQGHIKTTINFLNKIYQFKEIIENKYILGICIGYQIFFNNSEEDINVKCFNIFNENIYKIDKFCCNSNFLPNIGWKKICLIKKHNIFYNIPKVFYQYFMHSYSCIYNFQKYSYGISKFNKFYFNSIIISKNKFLFQFHPEKSGKIGLKLIENFLKL